MGLNAIILITLAIAGGAISGCVPTKYVDPADRNAKNQTWRFDCCNPGLNETDKWFCKEAARVPNHTFWDEDGNKYEFIWSDCEVGKEPWRKYEN